jgi:Zn-dependent metalloprotease
VCSKSIRHSVLCILPPHILRAIVERGTETQRSAAIRTLAVDATLRALRAAPPAFERGRPIAPSSASGEKRRTIYSAGHRQNLPGRVVATEDSRPDQDADPAVREAFEGLGATWDFYAQIFDRRSIDDEGMALDATVHYGDQYNNAFWNSRQMVFGDGDGELFNRFTISVDVIGHELTHGVTEDEAGLVYMFQAGAINESISDVFGSLIKQRLHAHTAQQADWLIGEGLFTSAVNGQALRSMKAPGTAYDDPVLGKDPQPGHMDGYVDTYNDNGGVHINSGIPNRAFYLAAVGMGGYAWERAGRIWYETLCDPALRPNVGFKRFANLTVSTAARLYGTGSAEEGIVADAWVAVGIAVPSTLPALRRATVGA